MEGEASAAVVGEVSKDAEEVVDSPAAAATVAVTGAVDEATPLTRSKEVFLQAHDLPRVMDWVMVFQVPALRGGSSFRATKPVACFSLTFFPLFVLESYGGFFFFLLFSTQMTKDIQHLGWHN